MVRGHGVELQQRKKSVHVGQNEIILTVPSVHRTYKRTLYIFNFILSWLGLTLVSMGIVMNVLKENVLLPSWMMWWFFGLGAIQLLLAAIANRGAMVFSKNLRQGGINWFLHVFLVFMTLFVLIEVSFAIITAVDQANIAAGNIDDKTNFVMTAVEDQLKEELNERESFWWEWQKSWDCCGWENNTIPDPLATGKYCTTDPAESQDPCKEVMNEYLDKNKAIIIVFAVAFLCSQMFVWYSACQLGCCIHAQEPIYASR